MSIYEIIVSRRTIRKFKPEEIKISILNKLVNTGRLAPSAANLQPLEYVIITKRNIRKKIFASISWAKYIEPDGNPRAGEEPTAYIIILVNNKINSSPYEDIGASAENITLAALKWGIGCCWISNFNKKNLKDILQLPEHFSVALVLALGYPLESPICEDIKIGTNIKYYKDSKGILHVPKRKLRDIIHLNCF